MGAQSFTTKTMRKALVVFFIVASAFAASDSYIAPENLYVDEFTATEQARPGEIANAISFAQAYKKGGNHKTLANVRALKTYSLAAYDKAVDFKNSHASLSKQALVDLIIAYGKPSKKAENIVTQYADVTGKLKTVYTAGIGKYLLDHCDKAVVFGSGATVESRNVIGAWVAQFNANSLGLNSPPHYFRTLAVKLSDYQQQKIKVDALSKNADAEAAAAWLMKGTRKKYKSFLARIVAKVKARSEKLWKKVIKSAEKAEKKKWKESKKLHFQPPSGVAGASKEYARLAKKLKMPSLSEMKKAAEKLAKQWQKRKKSTAKSIKKVIKKIEKKDEDKDNKKAAAAKTADAAKKKAAEKDAKKKTAKQEAKKKTKKAQLTCTTTTATSNKAGVVKAAAKKGYTMVGGGMTSNYRKWDKIAGFEEAMPEDNSFRCDTGFGPGKLKCYARSCTSNVGALSCTTKSLRFKGSGVRDATLPKGYVMTGGGLNNHYRSWNAKAGFEESRPNGNTWRGDMGFGWGDYTVYVRGCKAPKGRKLMCVTKASGRGNYNKVTCPAGYTVTGCGINNHYRKWDAKSGYEQHNPHGNNQCHCDTAFGTGDNTCYARCCKLQ